MNQRYKNVKPIQLLLSDEDEAMLQGLAEQLQITHQGHKSASRAARHVFAVYRRLSDDLRQAAIVAHEDV